MLADELGASEGAVAGVEAFRDFFNAAARRERFRKLMPSAHTPQDVALGVIGGAIGAPDLSTESIVRTYLCSLSAGDDPFGALEKFGAAQAFANLELRREQRAYWQRCGVTVYLFQLNLC